jgi:hypothetical protein
MSNLDHLFHRNQYLVEAACAYCQGKQNHEPWCATQDPQVFYAYAIVSDGSKLTFADSLVLHSLGVTWDGSYR